MRFISGKYKGLKIEGYDIKGTRPTMDRVKESLFAMIQMYMKDAIVLDLFAGTGSLGLEAISNGARSCYFVDQNYKCIEAIHKTVHNNRITEPIVLWKMDYQKALQTCKEKQIQFDIIFLDPPYAFHYIKSILSYIKDNNLLKENGIIVCEYETECITIDYFSLIKERKYGSKYIKIYQK